MMCVYVCVCVYFLFRSVYLATAQEVIREEAKLRREKEALWSACEAATSATAGRSSMAPGGVLSLAVQDAIGGIGSATEAPAGARGANAGSTRASSPRLNGSSPSLVGRANLGGAGGSAGASGGGFDTSPSSFVRGGESDGDADPGTEVDVGGVDEGGGASDGRGGDKAGSTLAEVEARGGRGPNERRGGASRVNGQEGSESSEASRVHANGKGGGQPEKRLAAATDGGTKGNGETGSPAGSKTKGSGLGPKGKEHTGDVKANDGGGEKGGRGGNIDEEISTAVPSGSKGGRESGREDGGGAGGGAEHDKDGAKETPKRPEGVCVSAETGEAPRHGGATPATAVCVVPIFAKDDAIKRECANGGEALGEALGESGGESRPAGKGGGVSAASAKSNGVSKAAGARGRLVGAPSERGSDNTWAGIVEKLP